MTWTAEAGYLRGHIPGALFLDNNYERNPESGWVDTFPPDRFAAACQALGIGDDTLVVAYDNNMSLHAARFWWTLSYYGHKNVRVLDGGWRRWVSEGGAVAFDRIAPLSSASFTPKVDPALIATYEEVRSGCPVGGANAADTVIWDTRTTAEFAGSVSRNKRPGHVAGAVHLDWMDLMDRATHRFKSPGNCVNCCLPRHHAGQGGLCLLTGRSPCGARRIRFGPAGLPTGPQLRRLHVRMGEPGEEEAPMEVTS